MLAPARHEPLVALHQVVCRLEESLVGAGVDRDGFFGYHPLPLTEFLPGLEACGEPRGRLLDLGCGLGTKLMLAHWLGWPELVGVERDERLAEIAKELVPEAEFHVADAFGWDCAGFDVIYTYRLCQDLERQHDLGAHIAATASPGTVVFYAGADMPCGERMADSVWRI